MGDQICLFHEFKGFCIGFPESNSSGSHMYAITCKASYNKTVFGIYLDLGKCPNHKTHDSKHAFSGWGTSAGPKSNPKEDFS